MNITLPTNIVFARGSKKNGISVEMTVATDSINAEIWAKLAAHGLTQKVGDAAAGKETEDEVRSSMMKVLDALQAGDWGVSRGEGVSEDVAIGRRLVGAKYRTIDKTDPKRVAWDKLTDEQKDEKADAIIAANPVWMPLIVEEKARLEKKRAEAKALAKRLSGADMGL